MSDVEIARTWVVAVTVLNINSGDTETKYYANGAGFTSKTTDTPASTHFAPRIIQALDLTRSLFGIRTTRGRSVFTPGDVVLNNADGALDSFMEEWVVDGQTITAYYGPQGDFAFPADFSVAFTGTMLDAEVSREEVRLKTRDRQAELNVPLQTTKFAGTNENGQGVEGGLDIAGKPKPVVYGAPRNVTPVLVNPSKNIYQVADKAMDSVIVYDRGVRLGLGLTQWTETNLGGAAVFAGTTAMSAASDGAGNWVVVGTSGQIVYSSDDGDTWTAATSGVATTLYDVYFGSGVWVVVGAAGVILSSHDMVTWTSRLALGGAADFFRVRYAAGYWVTVGQQGRLYTSDSGLVWTSRTSSMNTSDANSYVRAVAYGNGRWVIGGYDNSAVSDRGQMAYATDPRGTWTSITVAQHGFTGTSGAVWGVVYDESFKRWVAVGRPGTTTTPIAIAKDGIYYSRSPSAVPTNDANHIDYLNGVLLLVTGANALTGRLFQSTDGGVSWEVRGGQVAGTPTWFGIGIDRVASRILAVGYAGGAPPGAAAFSPVRASYATLADLQDDAQKPDAGGYGVLSLSSGTYVRLGAPPDGIVTCDPVEQASDADMTAGQVSARVLEDRASMTSGDYSGSDVTTLDSANDAVVGFYADSETEIGTVLDQVNGSVGAAWFSDTASDFRFKRFQKPSGSPVVSFKATNLKRPLQRVQSQDPQGGLPSYSAIVQWGKNYTPQAADIAGAVEPDRRNELIASWYKAEATNTSVRDRHPLSPQIVDESLLTTETDAQDEANRRLALREERTDVFEVVVPLTDTNIAIELNDVIELIHDRYGLNIEGDDEFGGLFRVIEIRADGADNELALVVWGRRPFNLVTSTGEKLITSTGAYLVAA